MIKEYKLEEIKDEVIVSEINKFVSLEEDKRRNHKNKFIGYKKNGNEYLLFYILKSSQRYSTHKASATKKFMSIAIGNSATSHGMFFMEDRKFSQVVIYRFTVEN